MAGHHKQWNKSKVHAKINYFNSRMPLNTSIFVITLTMNNKDAVTIKLNLFYPPVCSQNTVAPPIEEMQAVFTHNAKVKKVFTEQIFNPRTMSYEKEHYVELENEEQAVYAVTLPQPLPNPRGKGYRGYTFTKPTQNTVNRAIYRVIGTCIDQLKDVDQKMVDLGAVATGDGFAVLPSTFISKEAFDSRIELIQTQIKADPNHSVALLHNTLVKHIGVDVERRQTMLDALVERRIELLLELHSFDRDTYPFTVDLKLGALLSTKAIKS